MPIAPIPAPKTDLAGFTLVEVIVVMVIVAILSTMAFLSYGTYMVSARDSTRVSDINQMKMLLKSERQKTGSYPVPGSAFWIVNSGTGNPVAEQGTMDTTVAINGLSRYPQDPVTNTYYPYSVTKNLQAFQIATVVEASFPPSAYVDGDYKSVAVNVLPSLLLAMTGAAGSNVEIGSGIVTAGSDGSANRLKFVLNGGKANLPYDPVTGIPKGNAALSFAGILSESGVVLTGNTRYRSCQDIADSGFWIGTGEYQILSSTGIMQNTNCP
jgi:prepilin-type N-terminal cleavage/methylation domain-containing protein